MANEKEYEQRQKLGFKMQKCPLCDKKVQAGANFCSHCGWDLSDHEPTPLEIARIQDGILDARFRAMHWNIAMVPFLTISAVCILVYTFAAFEVIPATWDFMRFMLYIGLVFLYIWIALSFPRDRQKKKQDRLKMMLRDRQLSQ